MCSVFIKKAPSFGQGLFPNQKPDTEVVHDDVQKKKISEDPDNHSKSYVIDDLIPASFHIIERTDASLSIQIVCEGSEKRHESDTAKYPFVIAIKNIGQ